jgi:hypothetical protein
MNARLQALFAICLVFPTVIHILDSDLRALAMFRKKLFAVVVVLSFLTFLCHILLFFLYTFYFFSYHIFLFRFIFTSYSMKQDSH